MTAAPYNFVGNIEGRQIPFGDADVVVADGFTGNLILKTYEGVAKVLMNEMKACSRRTPLRCCLPGCVRRAKEYENQVRL